LDRLADADLAVVVNPNNPDGRLLARADLLALAGKLAKRGGVLVVDEAFMDVGPDSARADPHPAHSRESGNPALLDDPGSPPAGGRTGPFGMTAIGAGLAGDVARGNVVVLRSFGKFFGLAGVRLGFAIAAEDIATRLRVSLGPWSVSGPAIAIGAAALADDAWIGSTQVRLKQAARRLDRLLAGAGLDVVGGTSLFRLAQTPAAAALYETLGRAGILARRFAEHPTWLRFGLPGDEPAWERLENVLADNAR
jgi:cobalamin biosynthetic protein CobC